MHSNNVFQYSTIRTRKRNAKESIKTLENWNPAFFGIRNPVPGIRNPQRGIQNRRMSWIPLHGAKCERANMDLIDDVKTALILFEHSIWRPVQVKMCSGGMLRSVGFSAQEMACYWIKNVKHQTGVSRQLTACTTSIYHCDTYDTIVHYFPFPQLLLADCHQALWVGMRSKTQKDDDEDCKNA